MSKPAPALSEADDPFLLEVAQAQRPRVVAQWTGIASGDKLILLHTGGNIGSTCGIVPRQEA
jgi:hypothetical protein